MYTRDELRDELIDAARRLIAHLEGLGETALASDLGLGRKAWINLLVHASVWNAAFGGYDDRAIIDTVDTVAPMRFWHTDDEVGEYEIGWFNDLSAEPVTIPITPPPAPMAPDPPLDFERDEKLYTYDPSIGF